MKHIKLMMILLMTQVMKTDFVQCTTDFKTIFDDVFKLIESFEDDYKNPDFEIVKGFLKHMDDLFDDCFNIQKNFSRYGHCLEILKPVSTQISDLVADIQAKKTEDILIDITAIGSTVTTTITCFMREKYAQIQ